MQQQTNDYYSKNVYKPQNYNAPTYYPTFVPYVSFRNVQSNVPTFKATDYLVGQQYVQSPASYTNANMVSGQEVSICPNLS
jgi:hypothetical protein